MVAVREKSGEGVIQHGDFSLVEALTVPSQTTTNFSLFPPFVSRRSLPWKITGDSQISEARGQ